jgi:hypothetical protein
MTKSKIKVLSEGAGKRVRKRSAKTGTSFRSLMKQIGKRLDKLLGTRHKKRLRA